MLNVIQYQTNPKPESNGMVPTRERTGSPSVLDFYVASAVEKYSYVYQSVHVYCEYFSTWMRTNPTTMLARIRHAIRRVLLILTSMVLIAPQSGVTIYQRTNDALAVLPL